MVEMIETERMPRREKRVNFAPDLVPLVTEGSKTSTWRIGDDKDFSWKKYLESLFERENERRGKSWGETPFAKAKVVNVVEKLFREFTEEDRAGHDGFEDNDHMVRTYQGYYPEANVCLNTPVKIIRFELIK